MIKIEDGRKRNDSISHEDDKNLRLFLKSFFKEGFFLF